MFSRDNTLDEVVLRDSTLANLRKVIVRPVPLMELCDPTRMLDTDDHFTEIVTQGRSSGSIYSSCRIYSSSSTNQGSSRRHTERQRPQWRSIVEIVTMTVLRLVAPAMEDTSGSSRMS